MLFAISVLWYISLILYQFGELLKLLWGQWIFECMYINRFWFNPIINYLYCRYYCGFVDQKKLDLFVPNICLSKHKMFHHLKNGENPVLFSRTKGKLFRIRLNLILKFISNNCFWKKSFYFKVSNNEQNFAINFLILLFDKTNSILYFVESWLYCRLH